MSTTLACRGSGKSDKQRERSKENEEPSNREVLRRATLLKDPRESACTDQHRKTKKYKKYASTFPAIFSYSAFFLLSFVRFHSSPAGRLKGRECSGLSMLRIPIGRRMDTLKAHRIYCHRYTTSINDSLTSSIRALMRSSAQPVAIITSLLPRRQIDSSQSAHVHGATLSSFSTISLDPPLLAFSLQTPSRMADSLQFQKKEEGQAHFVLNILSEAQKEEAAGFAKPGLAPFSIGSDWMTTFDINDHDNDMNHPLSQSPFHPSKVATNTEGVSVPVLSNSLGSLACSLVSVTSLKEFDNNKEKVIKADDSNQVRSKLFIARVHGVEVQRRSNHSPLVYWNQQFTSVKR